MGTVDSMGLFSRPPAVDLRDRDYVLTDSPLVAQDDRLVLVDVTVRLAVREARPGEDLVLGYNPDDERALHAICVLVLRLLAEDVPSDELLIGRARVVEAVERGFAFAPVGAGVDARVLSVEVRPWDDDVRSERHEFRVVDA